MKKKTLYEFTTKEAEEKLKSFIEEDEGECEVKICDIEIKSFGFSGLRHLKTIQLSKTSGKDLISKSSKVFQSYIDSDFTNWGLNKTQSPTKEIKVDILELVKYSTFKEMFTNPEKQVMTQSQIISFCQNHVQDLRQGGDATFFLIKVNGEYFVVYVRVRSDGLGVLVRRFWDDDVWDAEYLRRVVVPQLIS